jgi:hypothetical protein
MSFYLLSVQHVTGESVRVAVGIVGISAGVGQVFADPALAVPYGVATV